MQKNKALCRAAAFMTAILFLNSSCKKNNADSSGGNTGQATVSFTVDGDGMVNQSVTINAAAGSTGNESIYNSKWNFTHGVVADNKTKFSFYTNGQQTGQQKLGTDFSNTNGPFTNVSIILEMVEADGTQRTYIYEDKTYAGNPLPPGSNINITKYEEVGGSVEGDFQGALFNNENLAIIKLSNGHFKIPRSKDVK